tara:strand:- start:39 stop:434 length:396 start_codon:yes stop_codon:yes gene_type:complete
MPNMYFKIDIETEVFTESGKKMKQSIEEISNIVIQYKGFSDVEFDYGIYIDKSDFVGDHELSITLKSPYNVKIKGLAKVKEKAELIQDFKMDKKQKFVLNQVHVMPVEFLITKDNKKPKKMVCIGSLTKPK